MTYQEIIESGLTAKEKNDLIKEIRQLEYGKVRSSEYDQIEYMSRNGADTIFQEKEKIRSLYPYVSG